MSDLFNQYLGYLLIGAACIWVARSMPSPVRIAIGDIPGLLRSKVGSIYMYFTGFVIGGWAILALLLLACLLLAGHWWWKVGFFAVGAVLSIIVWNLGGKYVIFRGWLQDVFFAFIIGWILFLVGSYKAIVFHG